MYIHPPYFAHNHVHMNNNANASKMINLLGKRPNYQNARQSNFARQSNVARQKNKSHDKKNSHDNKNSPFRPFCAIMGALASINYPLATIGVPSITQDMPCELLRCTIGWNHQQGDIGLGGAGNHVLDEIAMAGGIDDGVVPLGGVELLGGAGDGHTTLTLLLLAIHVEGEGEGRLTSHSTTRHTWIFDTSDLSREL